jgi:hypothetical protein
VFLAGCALLSGLKDKRETEDALARAHKYMEKGDYDAAERENIRIISACANMYPADEAFLNLGLIYAHPGNPKRDPDKAAASFKKVLTFFPESRFAGQAKILIGVVQKYEKMTQENERLEKEVQELKTTIKKSKQIDLEIDLKKKELLK